MVSYISELKVIQFMVLSKIADELTNNDIILLWNGYWRENYSYYLAIIPLARIASL